MCKASGVEALRPCRSLDSPVVPDDSDWGVYHSIDLELLCTTGFKVYGVEITSIWNIVNTVDKTKGRLSSSTAMETTIKTKANSLVRVFRAITSAYFQLLQLCPVCTPALNGTIDEAVGVSVLFHCIASPS